MMPSLPHFERDEPWHKVSARAMNAWVDATRANANLAVGPGLDLTHLSTGWLLSLSNSPSELGRDMRRRVAVVEPPNVERNYLMVRAAKYAGTPPVPGEYEWHDEPFEAYPEIGLQPGDYGSVVWTGDGAPTDETTFLTALRVREYWLLDIPVAANIQLCVVKDIGTGNEHYVMVQLIEPNPESNPWDGSFRFVPNSAPQYANCWSNFKSRHYAPLVFPGPTLTAGAEPCALVQVGGAWYVLSVWRFAAQRAPLESVRVSDCTMARSRVYGAYAL